MNLVTNSAYAMRERGGKLFVTLEPVTFDADLLARHPHLRAGPGVCLTIADTGFGMDAATQQRLFEPFFTTKPADEGTGLGLAVVRGIVKSHEAAIVLESAPQKGTTFRIYFPAAIPASALPTAVPLPTPRGHGERLLLIDDEPSVSMIAELMLARLGYEVDAFSHPVSALAAFRQAPNAFEAVITDLMMPGMSGLDITREILAIRRDVPVLLMSGNVQVNDVARAQAAGVCTIIEKPFSMQQLAQRLETALAGRVKSA
jgi:CheY-like chemotaxis protein